MHCVDDRGAEEALYGVSRRTANNGEFDSAEFRQEQATKGVR
jgi:hypothetical protein